MDLTKLDSAEMSVIGAIMIDPENVLPAVLEKLRPKDFGDSSLRHLFEAARALYLAQKPVDPVTIGRASSIGDYTDLAREIMLATPTAANVMEYAEIVRKTATLRNMRSIGFALIDCKSAEEARELLTQAQALLVETRSTHGSLWRDLARELMAKMDEPPREYLDLGIEQLNSAVHITKGKFVVFGAESSVGKTAMTLQMAYAIAKSGKRVGFFSLETDDETLSMRVMSQQAYVRMKDLQKHQPTPENVRSMVAEIDDSWDYELKFFDAAGDSVSDIRAKILANRLDVAFIDYVQLIRANGENAPQQVRNISMELHTMARQLNVTVFGLSQVTLPQRDAKGHRPEISKHNLRESQQLSNDADFILLMDLTDLDDYSSPRIFKVDKNKDGACYRMILKFNAPYLRFEYMPPLNESAERNETMDRNRAKKAAKAAERTAAKNAQESAFRELENDNEENPF